MNAFNEVFSGANALTSASYSFPHIATRVCLTEGTHSDCHGTDIRIDMSKGPDAKTHSDLEEWNFYPVKTLASFGALIRTSRERAVITRRFWLCAFAGFSVRTLAGFASLTFERRLLAVSI